MRRIGVRLPSQLWTSVQWYGCTAGLVGAEGAVDISETIRDLISRGLVSDRSAESGYRSGYAAGRSAAYADFMRRVGMPETPSSRGRKRP